MSHRTRIVVIGAGVLGTALAHRLARGTAYAGTPRSGEAHAAAVPAVTLLDRAEPGRGTSRWSLAWLNSNGVTDRGYHELRTASLRAWARLAEEAGGAEWYRPVGNMRWADPAPDDPDDPAGGRLTERVRRLRSRGYPAHLVPPARAAALEPSLRLPKEVREVAWFPGEGYVRTERFVAALTARLRQAGADVRTGDAGQVTALERTGPGLSRGSRATGCWLVHTADGPTVRADVVVSCTGRWTPEVTGLAGQPVPIVDPSAPDSPAPGLVARVGPVATPLQRVVHTPHVHLRPHGEATEEGSATAHLEAGDVDVDLHTPPGELDRWADTLLDRARALVPGLSAARVLERRVCVRPLPLDGHPVVGPLPSTRERAGGLYVVVTHSGVTLAAGLAELIAAELVTGRPEPALDPYRPGAARIGWGAAET